MVTGRTWIVLRKNIDPRRGLMNGAIGCLIEKNLDTFGDIESLVIDFGGNIGIVTLFKSIEQYPFNVLYKNFPVTLKASLTTYHLQCNK
jgi:hypothetical protein